MTGAVREFVKMSGSGNDFVVLDAREESAERLVLPERVRSICARGTGVGADGLVVIRPSEDPSAHARMIYFNSDGSRGEMCGNAALCTTRLVAESRGEVAGEIRFLTDSGTVRARLVDGLPEIELPAVVGLSADAGIPLAAGELRIGFVQAGVPHLGVLVEEAERVDVLTRGQELRRHPSLERGANANFLARKADGTGWAIRTYERGVEAETLACGTGAVASAALLRAWRETGDQTTLWTRSGRPLVVTFSGVPGAEKATLRGEGRIVFRGVLEEG